MEAEYIALYKYTRGVLPFVSIKKQIWFILEIQRDTPKVMCSLSRKLVKVQEENQGVVRLSVATKIRPWTNHILIKYHHFPILVANVDVEIKHVNTKEYITENFT